MRLLWLTKKYPVCRDKDKKIPLEDDERDKNKVEFHCLTGIRLCSNQKKEPPMPRARNK